MAKLFSTKAEIIEFYKDKLTNDKNAAMKGLLHVYANQTSSEKETKTTHLFNGVGFTGADAKSCSIVANIILFRMNKGYISEKQRNLLERLAPKVRKAMPKYTTQIVSDLLDSGKIVKSDRFYTFAN